MNIPSKINPLGVVSLPAGYLCALFLTTTASDQGIYTNHRSINGQTVEIKGRLTGKSSIFGQVNNTTGSNMWLDFALDNAYDSWFFRATSAMHLAQYWNSDKNFFSTQDHVYIYDDTNYLLTVDGKAAGNNYKQNYTYADAPLALFGKNVVSRDLTYKIESRDGTRVFYCKITAADGTAEANYVPAIDAYGVPCMFEKVTKQPFYNEGSGSFIVGMTVAQARKLGKLPAGATTKTLTISLPQSAFVDVETGEIADAAVNAALAQAEANGWVITKQYYTES